jgi:hypothetical protein
MTTEERTWSAPELIALVRGEPEEAVLISCKGGPSFANSSMADQNCVGAGADCVECNTVVAS